MEIIDILKYILIGFIQGVSEVLPISSSAHLLIIGWLIDFEISITFEIILHFASLIGILLFMRKKIIILVKETILFIFKKEKRYKESFNYIINLCVSTLILVMFSLILDNYVEKVFTKLYVVGILLVINGIIIFIFLNFKGNKKDITIKDSIIIGLFEGIGVFPGISRSGITLSGCNFCKIDKKIASDYVFMLFVPASLGAFVYKINNFNFNINNSSIIIGIIISFAVTVFTTYFSFKILINIIKKRKISIFGYYCIVIGLIVYLLNI